MPKRRLLLIGGGGHCRSVIDSIQEQDYEKIGIIEKTMESNTITHFPVIGTDDMLPELYGEGWTDAFITVAGIGNADLRRKLWRQVHEIGFHVPVIIDGTAVVSPSAALGTGCFVGKRAVVNAGVRLGMCSIINSGAIIEHDCYIGSFVHVSPGAILCGGVCIGEDVHIGAGAVIRECRVVGSHALIGLGSTVVKDIPENAVAFGNPCEVRR